MQLIDIFVLQIKKLEILNIFLERKTKDSNYFLENIKTYLILLDRTTFSTRSSIYKFIQMHNSNNMCRFNFKLWLKNHERFRIYLD